MERMKRLQEEREAEEASQEEMATRFEKEKKESLLVAATGMCPEGCRPTLVRTSGCFDRMCVTSHSTPAGPAGMCQPGRKVPRGPGQ